MKRSVGITMIAVLLAGVGCAAHSGYRGGEDDRLEREDAKSGASKGMKDLEKEEDDRGFGGGRRGNSSAY